MSHRNLSKYFVLMCCLILVKSYVIYQWKTDLNYRRQVTAVTVPVASLSVCASQCAAKAQCVSFFFNIREFLCQTEGRIHLSFDGSDGEPWRYYEIKTQNVAIKKTVWMSTEHNPPYHDRKYAVDAKVVLDGWGSQCSHTQGEFNPWILVDLGAIYNPKYVTLFNRIDDQGNRLHDVFVSLGETNTDFPVDCGQYKGPGVNAEVVHIVCPNNARGRFVKTEIKGPSSTKYLTLCEIRILIS
ncbi:fucolectin-like [Ostrea edulis]|uniref:fucolectin-like n=1 Tax=Ostrea edulis TaxID=37623 RepID=UPI0024AF5F86|nr:fucolectin-like [Ostrea edulis]